MLKLVCAWCRGVIREGAEPVSHGICPRCAAAFREAPDLKKSKASA